MVPDDIVMSNTFMKNTSRKPARANGMRRARYLLQHGKHWSLPKTVLRLGGHPHTEYLNGHSYIECQAVVD